MLLKIITVILIVVPCLLLGTGREVGFSPFYSFSLFLISSLALYFLTFRSWKSSHFNKRWAFIIILAGIALRICFYNYPLSDDVNRYAWEGYVMNQKVNPYVTSPEKLAHEFKNDPIFKGINHKKISTAYPPVALLTFKYLSAWNYSLKTYKIFFIAVDSAVLIVLAVLLYGLRKPSSHLMIYAFNPLVLLYIAGEGHMDAMNILFIAIALIGFCMQRESKSIMAMAMFFLGMAVMTKYLAIIFLPFFITRKNVKLLPFFFVPFLLFIPFIESGTFSGLITFSSGMAYNDVIPKILRVFFDGQIYSLLMITIFGLGLCAIWLICQKNKFQGCLYAYLWCLFCLPAVHGWYLLPLLLFSVVYQNRTVFVFCTTIAFGFWVLNYQITHGIWKEFWWIWTATYLPVFIVAIIDLLSDQRAWFEKFNPVKSIDIIIPVYNEETWLKICLQKLDIAVKILKISFAEIKVKVIVVDGGSSDNSLLTANEFETTAFTSKSKGRGNQIAEGVAAGHGDIVVTLHADAIIHENALVRLVKGMNKSHAHWGVLGHYYDSNRIRMRFIELINSFRFYFIGFAFGDQGIFVRRTVLENVGTPRIPLMEDVEMSVRLLDRPRKCLGRNLTISARRWEKHSTFSYTWLVAKYVLQYLTFRKLGANISTISNKLYIKYYS